MKAKINNIDEYVVSEAFRKIANDGSFKGAYLGYWKLVKKFGLDGVHYLERAEHTNPIKGIKTDAAILVTREWRDRRSIRHQYLSAALALFSAIAAVISALVALNATSSQSEPQSISSASETSD